MIARYAIRECAAIAAGGLVAALGVGAVGGVAAGAAPLALAGALLAFFRDPTRATEARPDVLFAPADGRVVACGRVEREGGAWLCVAVFMSILDVHVNRAPCAGRVRAITRAEGGHRPASDPAASHENAAIAMTIEPAAPLTGPIVVRQIAGVLARGIICAAPVGGVLAAGERFGMIKLGSRCELLIPDDGGWLVMVARGERVQAGVTVLAERRMEAAGAAVALHEPPARSAAATVDPPPEPTP